MTGKKHGQNMIEVVLIIPLLLVIILGILEYALFQRNVSTVQDIAVEASVAASKHYVDENSCNVPSPPGWCSDGAAYDPTENPAVHAARQLIIERLGTLGLTGLNFSYNDMGPAYGDRPFALYEFNSNRTVEYKGDSSTPLITFTIDYRDPVRSGVSTQLIYHYNLVLFGLEFSIPGVNNGRKIVIIPSNVQISSTQTKQYVHY